MKSRAAWQLTFCDRHSKEMLLFEITSIPLPKAQKSNSLQEIWNENLIVDNEHPYVQSAGLRSTPQGGAVATEVA